MPQSIETSAPTVAKTELHTAVAGASSQCAECGAHLAPDQRYCVECGQRSGEPRLPVMDGRVRRAPEPALAPAKRRSGPRFSAGTTVIAGIATLLLAMGIGVLIGRSGNDTSKSAGAQIITVNGGGAAASGATGGSGAAVTAAASGGGGSKKNKGKKTANSSGGGGGIKAATPKVVTVGSPGHGPGYQNGKFTGNFFGQ